MQHRAPGFPHRPPRCRAARAKETRSRVHVSNQANAALPNITLLTSSSRCTCVSRGRAAKTRGCLRHSDRSCPYGLEELPCFPFEGRLKRPRGASTTSPVSGHSSPWGQVRGAGMGIPTGGCWLRAPHSALAQAAGEGWVRGGCGRPRSQPSFPYNSEKAVSPPATPSRGHKPFQVPSPLPWVAPGWGTAAAGQGAARDPQQPVLRMDPCTG